MAREFFLRVLQVKYFLCLRFFFGGGGYHLGTTYPRLARVKV